MKLDRENPMAESSTPKANPPRGTAKALLQSSVADSIDLLVDYLADNDVSGIHSLIMGEVEKRLIIKALQHSRGNKQQAARMLGMSRNTFQRKFTKITHSGKVPGTEPEA